MIAIPKWRSSIVGGVLAYFLKCNAVPAPYHGDGIHGISLIYHHHNVFHYQICGATSCTKCYNSAAKPVCINQPHKNPPSSASLSATV
jgi:hypothetical protein